MEQILSHTFSFPSKNNSDSSKQNILSITQEGEKKHFVQYIQYKVTGAQTLSLRYVNIKVDRAYYLEMANINSNDEERRRYVFSILGKRRFGANNKTVDYYLTSKLDTNHLHKAYLKNYEAREFNAEYTQTTPYSTNEYRISVLKVDGHNTVFMDQISITPRKKIHKIFCVELYDDEIQILLELEKPKERVNYLFNKIGKIHFRSLQVQKLHLNDTYKEFHELALSKLVASSREMERTSRLHDNLVFRKLKDITQEHGRIDKELTRSCELMMQAPQDKSAIEAFTNSLDTYVKITASISPLEEMLSYFTNISMLVSSGSLGYLLNKKDCDLQDIFLYMLESFEEWNVHLNKEIEDVRAFNIATIDFNASLRHLVDICYKFKHEYKCSEAECKEEESLPPAEKPQEVLIEYMNDESITSASEYFSEVDLDREVLDELFELDSEIELLFYSTTYTKEVDEVVQKFFEGYTHALNPLFEFKDLSYSLTLLGQKLSEYEADENSEMVVVLVQAFITDILEWKKTVLVEKTADNIHYMDKSFYSNIAQIELSLTPQDAVDFEDEIEFF